MYEHQSERMTLGMPGISADESISDYQHIPYKKLRKSCNSRLSAKFEIKLLTMHALSDDRSSWTTAAY